MHLWRVCVSLCKDPSGWLHSSWPPINVSESSRGIRTEGSGEGSESAAPQASPHASTTSTPYKTNHIYCTAENTGSM